MILLKSKLTRIDDVICDVLSFLVHDELLKSQHQIDVSLTLIRHEEEKTFKMLAVTDFFSVCKKDSV